MRSRISRTSGFSSQVRQWCSMEEIAVISIVAHGGRAKAKIALADDGQC